MLHRERYDIAMLTAPKAVIKSLFFVHGKTGGFFIMKRTAPPIILPLAYQWHNASHNIHHRQPRPQFICEIARELLANAGKKIEPIKIGENPETKKIIYYYPTGRYGAYISSNRVNVSVRERPDLETAIQLINNKAKK